MFIIDRFEDDWVILEFGRKTLACPGSLYRRRPWKDVLKIMVNIDAALPRR